MFVNVILLVAMFATSVWAGPSCIKRNNPCDPNLLCTFKAEFYSKAILYWYYAMNDPSRKGKKKTADGILWNGILYNQAMEEARAMDPKAPESEIKQKASSIFQEKIRYWASESFSMPQCELGGQPQVEKITKKGYMGMYTKSEDCSVWVNHYAAPIKPSEYGRSDKVCEEIYNRDFAHEQMHANICKKAKGSKKEHRDEIDHSIKEELKAYKHTLDLTRAYYNILLAQCSPRLPNNNSIRKEMNTITNLLKGYEARISQ